MKKKIFCFFPILVALALSSCSNNDEPTNVGNNTGNKDCGFVAVNIVQPKATTFKAGTAPEGFEYGEDAENQADNGLFFVFNQDGTQMYGEPQVISLTNSGNKNDGEKVEKIYNAVLVIDGAKQNPLDEAVQIVCVLNAPAELASKTTLSELKSEIDRSTINPNGPFVMSNSVYKNGDVVVLGETITKDDIFLSADSALHAPVNIYVERTVAKVRTNAVNAMDNTAGAKPVVDGAEKPLTINITGLSIANIAESAYLFKNIDDLGATYAWAWDAANHRSYWETTPHASGTQTYQNKTYSQISTGFDATKGIENEYIRPNTGNQKTAILVTAQLMDGSNPADIVYLRGSYFPTEKAKNLIAQYLANNGYYKEVSADNYSQLSATDFKWVNKVDDASLTWLKSYEVVAQIDVPEGGTAPTLKKRTATGTYENATVEEVNRLLAGNASDAPYKARVYTNGYCYYFVNIDQSSLSGATYTPHQYDGVVRNHIYDLTLNSISGIGIPVFDPTDIIIPEDLSKEKLYYLAATVNILDWKLVTQTVDFNN